MCKRPETRGAGQVLWLCSLKSRFEVVRVWCSLMDIDRALLIEKLLCLRLLGVWLFPHSRPASHSAQTSRGRQTPPSTCEHTLTLFPDPNGRRDGGAAAPLALPGYAAAASCRYASLPCPLRLPTDQPAPNAGEFLGLVLQRVPHRDVSERREGV